VDLSAVMFDDKFEYKDVISYYNLKSIGGCHSGDIVDAPKGASEFIDITPEKVLWAGARYVGVIVNSYTTQPYCDLPECFAGWMSRNQPSSGEIYEPKSVHDKFDLTADTQIAIPMMFDLKERTMIWCDFSLRRYPSWHNNVHTNLGGVRLSLMSMLNLNKPSLYDLFRLHGSARGTLVDTESEADTRFSVAEDTPYDIDGICSKFLA